MLIKRNAVTSLGLLVSTILAIGGFGSSMSAGASSSRATATWAFTSVKVNAGTPISVSYRVSGVRAGSLLTFEREFGTAKVWKPVAKFKLVAPGDATVSLPSDPIGSYLYKLRVTTGRKVVRLTSSHPLYSYGDVSFLTICNGATGGNGVNCGSGSVQLQNSTIYNYQDQTNTYASAAPGTNEISFPNTSCRSGSLTIETGYSNATQPGDVSTVQIAQSASDPQLTSLPDTSQTVFNFNLDGGPFVLDDWSNDSNNGEVLYYSGTFNCYTLNGLR